MYFLITEGFFRFDSSLEIYSFYWNGRECGGKF